MKTITYKNKRETDRELKHIDVYENDIYIGYIIKDNPYVGTAWHFCPLNYATHDKLKEPKLKDLKELLEK